jgi:hypothetical protein
MHPYVKTSIVQIIFFILALFPILYNLFHHHRRGFLAWTYFAIFSILRIISCSLLISADHHLSLYLTSTNLQEVTRELIAAIVVESAGTTVLVLAAQGLLFEVYFSFILYFVLSQTSKPTLMSTITEPENMQSSPSSVTSTTSPLLSSNSPL